MTITQVSAAQAAELLRNATPGPVKLPVEVDSIDGECGHGKYSAYAIFDADGRAICDTLNCDERITRLEEEHDGDENGDWHRMWDEQARLNMNAIATALNTAPALAAELISVSARVVALESALAGLLDAVSDLSDDARAEFGGEDDAVVVAANAVLLSPDDTRPTP